MKTLILKGMGCLAFFLISSLAFAQTTNLVVSNSTDCYYYVKAKATNSTNCDGCTGVACIPPNTEVAISPCGGEDLNWNAIEIAPADQNCRECERPVTVSRLFSCFPYPNTATGHHCDGNCATFTADFSTANTLLIY